MKVEIEIMLNTIEKVKEFASIISPYDDIDVFIRQKNKRNKYDAHSILGIFAMNLIEPLVVTIYSDNQLIIKEIIDKIYKYKNIEERK